MNIYIRSAACISPQPTFGDQPSWAATEPNSDNPSWATTEPNSDQASSSTPDLQSDRLTCIEPDYKTLLDAKALRRMSRIIRMGVATANDCLQQAHQKEPHAIITGTAYGCLEDTGVFLQSLVERKEQTLQPAPFIQSTHNTVGAQIALMLQCTRYNNTFVHRGASFENALLDAILLLKEGEAETVLTGAVDEITDTSHAILQRFGLYRHARAGEGAAFFLLASQPSPTDQAKLDGMTTLYKPGDTKTVENALRSFLEQHDAQPDLVITGTNGDNTNDQLYRQLAAPESIFAGKNLLSYKQLCGEYPTSTAFAFWMAARLLKEHKHRQILVYNHYLGIHHTAFLLSAVVQNKPE
jgi:3-oxoacyl-[acyl-carrier-protein] synthase II